MPVRSCQINNQPGFKWGTEGKCYEYTPGDEESKNDAKKKAITQGVAIGDLEALGAQIQVVKGTYKFAVEKIGFDFDGVLSTRSGQQLWNRVGGDYVITARSMFRMNEVWVVTDRLGIPRDRVIDTGSNQRKIQKVKDLGITTFYDNNSDVIKFLPGIGKLFNP
jgi:hypothetical protein